MVAAVAAAVPVSPMPRMLTLKKSMVCPSPPACSMHLPQLCPPLSPLGEARKCHWQVSLMLLRASSPGRQ